MLSIKPPDPRSVLLITLDSCRYDTCAAARTPNISRVGELHRVMSPGNFTYASHAAMFVGFTPGDPMVDAPYVNPARGRIFYMRRPRRKAPQPDYMELEGRNVIDGFRRRGFLTIGSGAMTWLNPRYEAGDMLVRDFEKFWHAGNVWSLAMQLEFIARSMAGQGGGLRSWFFNSKADAAARPQFVFLNVGETHTPYWHEGAKWDRDFDPCVSPYAPTNDASVCRQRQTACLEFADRLLGPLIDAFLCSGATIVICGDHGDCWGEDGLWGHTIHHPKAYEVPLLFKLSDAHKPVMS